MKRSNPCSVFGGGEMNRATSSVESMASSDAASDGRSSRSVTMDPFSVGSPRVQGVIPIDTVDCAFIGSPRERDGHAVASSAPARPPRSKRFRARDLTGAITCLWWNSTFEDVRRGGTLDRRSRYDWGPTPFEQ